jgi:hypothetical protein
LWGIKPEDELLESERDGEVSLERGDKECSVAGGEDK